MSSPEDKKYGKAAEVSILYVFQSQVFSVEN